MWMTRIALLALAPGCLSTVGPEDMPPTDRSDGVLAPVERAAPQRTGEGPLELSVDGSPARPVAEVPSLVSGRESGPGHVEDAGWSTDGRTFAYCRPTSPDCRECRFVGRDGVHASLESGSGCGEGAVPSTTLDARLAALAPATTRWSEGSDVVLVLETREHEETNAGQPRPMLKLGARRRAGGPPAWLLHVDPCQGCGTDQVCAAAAHVDALALSPDGEALAVLVHQRSSQGDESLRVELLATSRVAAAARAPASRAAP